MNTGRFLAGSLALPLFCTVALAQAPLPLPVLDDKPTPQLDAGGPSAAVTALAFDADGQTLYAAGLDKLVRVWTLQKGHFVLKTAYRVPIGPGNTGAVNTVALSPDGAWVAMAGRAPMRGEAGFRLGGVIVKAPALSPEQHLDIGVIYVASTANPAGGKVLRGHRGEVRALAFAPANKGKPPLLVSAATEREGSRRFGGLRLWDVASGETLAERTDLPAKATRPGLAVWHTGPAKTQVRVAVAWPDEDNTKPAYLHLWDTDPDADPWQGWENDAFGQTAAMLGPDGTAGVLTGGVGPDAGRVRVWHLSPERRTRAQVAAEIPFSPRDGIQFLPVSLAVVPTRGPANYAAVVLQPSADADFHLAVVDLRARRIVTDVALARSDKTQLPAIAASGRHIAVAATSEHAVQVYAVADLLQGKPQPEVVLAGNGLTPRRVAFADKGRSLWLSEDRRARPLSGGLLFDLDKRQVRSNDRAKLAADSPELGEWSIAIDPDRKGVRVRQGQKEMPAVRLPGKDDVVTAAALRPAAPGQPGVLAVAYTERDASRTLIMLCDPREGKGYSLLLGHLQDVRELAFSASRPLLASVAEDQRVCVWSLADLDSAVGQVPGLEVGERGNNVVVRGIEPGSPAAKAGLADGDVLEKVGTPGAEEKPVKDAAGFLLAVSARRPGDQVEVAVAGKGTVKLPVERGVEGRKPLFSLFLQRTRQLPEWVGWSPAGPYDYSSPTAEAHLGWHTNTGDPAAPVSYAAAREYRKDYYREGILRYLAAEADLGRALQKWNNDHPPRPPQPALRPLRPDGAVALERADEFAIRQAAKRLRVGINEDYALDDKHQLRFRVTRSDGDKIKAGAAEIAGQAVRDGKDWEMDLSDVQWRRGEYRVRVGLHAGAGGPELASTTVKLRFQPPAPVVALRLGGKAVQATEQRPLKVTEDKLTLQVALEAPPAQQVEVQFAQARNGVRQKDAPAARIQLGATAFAQEFKLQEGLNRLMVRAVNKGALSGHEDEETADADVWVSYNAPRELPPRFTMLRLEPQPDVQYQAGKEVWVVNRPAVRLIGKIEGARVLVQADWSAGGAAKSVLPAREGPTAAFAVNLDLKAGEIVPIQLRAKSRHSDPNTAERSVVFYPPLPVVVVDPLESQDVLTDKVTLTGTFQATTRDPFDLLFRVTSPEDKTKSFKPEVDLKAGKWRVDLSLFPGGNNVEAIVANKWRGERTVEGTVTLRYRRPPQITAFPKEVEAVETNKVKLPLTVTGPAGRPLRAIHVDGNPVRFEVGKLEAQGGYGSWKVELPEVYVFDGDRNLDQVSIQAVSDEGKSPAAIVRVVHKKLPRLPRARFLSPAAADTARRPDYLVSYRIESERPLQRVEIRRGSEALYQADLKKVGREGPRYVLQEEALLGLVNGANTLELIAVNSDGRSPRAEVVVGYTAPAVLATIDRVELLAEGDQSPQVLNPVYRTNSDVTFPAAPRSLVWVVGRARWSDPKARALDERDLEIVAKVGDCRQLPVALGPRGTGDEANVRPFRIPLVLIAPENKITIELPAVGTQELSCREFQLPCTAPAKNQRLHLLIVGVNVKDWTELKERVLDALVVEPKDRPPGAQGEFFKKPPFERCVLYHVLAGDVDRGKVEAQLVEINNEIGRLKRETGWLNDVVLIYYQGEDVEVPGRKERWLKTTRNFQFPKVPPQTFAIPCQALPRVPGVELLLLNVPSTADTRVAGRDWGGDPDTGLLRYAYRDRTESAKPDPALLALLQEAVRKKGRLGEVVSYVGDLVKQQPAKFSDPLIVLDEYQSSRQINEPGR